MFNYGVFRKTLGDSAWSLGISAVALVAFVVLFGWAMINMGAEVLEFVSRITFIRRIFEMSFGISVEGEVSMNTLFSVCFTHGVTLALTWTVIIATATRITAAEIERGTADMLLSLPVTRTEVYFSASLVWVMAAIILSYCPIIGIGIATQIFETNEVVEISRYLAPATNFLCVNLAVGGIASMVASWCNRRGQSVGIVVGIVLLSAILNFLEPFIEAIKSIRFLSLLSYFRPVDVVRTGEWPVTQMATLVVLAAICCTVGLVVFSRKDIPTA